MNHLKQPSIFRGELLVSGRVAAHVIARVIGLQPTPNHIWEMVGCATITLSTCAAEIRKLFFQFTPYNTNINNIFQDWFGTFESMIHSLYHGGIY